MDEVYQISPNGEMQNVGSLLQVACMNVIRKTDVVPAKPTVKDLIQFVDDNFQQAEIPVEHFFSKGFYWREIVMPTGMVGAGHVHKHRHLNFALSGRAIVTWDGQTQEIEAPFIFWSEPGAQKAFQVFEEMRWLTRHDNPDELRDIRQIEEMIFELPQSNKDSGLTVDEFRMTKKPLCLG